MKINNNEGNSLVELIMVMMLLVLLGVMMYTLIVVSLKTQNQIDEQKNAQMDARIALSYVDTRIRQNDVRNKIEIKSNEINGQNSIVIKERGQFGSYDVWIYWSNGILREEVTDVGEQPVNLNDNKISSIYGFDVKMDEDGIISTYVTYIYNDKMKTIVNKTYLRSR